MKKTSHSVEETAQIAKEWLTEVTNKQSQAKEALVVGLSGHLGAGKTAFTKAVAKLLGIEEEITSPTFVIMKIYPIANSSWKRLVHIDAYRLEEGRELEVLGFEKLVSDPENLILIEWPEQVQEILKDISNYTTIHFNIPDSVSDTKNREISFE